MSDNITHSIHNHNNESLTHLIQIFTDEQNVRNLDSSIEPKLISNHVLVEERLTGGKYNRELKVDLTQQKTQQHMV